MFSYAYCCMGLLPALLFASLVGWLVFVAILLGWLVGWLECLGWLFGCLFSWLTFWWPRGLPDPPRSPLGWVGLGWVGLGWVGLGWVGLLVGWLGWLVDCLVGWLVDWLVWLVGKVGWFGVVGLVGGQEVSQTPLESITPKYVYLHFWARLL